MEQGFFLQTVIWLGSAVVCVTLLKRLGMSSIIGYLMAGILIGPFVLGWVGSEGKDIMHFGEFGVVIMLFIIGLELEPRRLWKMRRLILGLGLVQMSATTAVIAAITHFVLFLTWQTSLAVALVLSMSSTAMVMQTLDEKGLMHTKAGRYSFLLLLFQDIALVPVLALIPLLSLIKHRQPVPDTLPLIDMLPAWLMPLAVIGLMSVMFVMGKYLLIPMLRAVTGTRLRELFAASSLLIVTGIAFLMQMVGLSPALGAFIGGMILANSEFKHELDSTLSPFKGLLLGLFFIAVGATLNFRIVIDDYHILLPVVAGIIAVKGGILYLTGRIFNLSARSNLIFTLGLAQVGEFAFILLVFSGQMQVIPVYVQDLLLAATAVSMILSPLVILLGETVFGTLVRKKPDVGIAEEIRNEQNRVIIAGFSHFGSMVGRFLKAHAVHTTILDYDSDRVGLVRKMGFKVYYGDATRADLLEAAGARDATILVSTISDLETNRKLITCARKHFPHLTIMARSKSRPDTYELIDLGVEHIYRDYVDTSIRMGADVLKFLGFRPYAVNRAARRFFRYDEDALYDLALHRHDRKKYIDRVKQEIQLEEELIRNDMLHMPEEDDLTRDGEQPCDPGLNLSEPTHQP